MRPGGWRGSSRSWAPPGSRRSTASAAGCSPRTRSAPGSTPASGSSSGPSRSGRRSRPSTPRWRNSSPGAMRRARRRSPPTGSRACGRRWSGRTRSCAAPARRSRSFLRHRNPTRSSPSPIWSRPRSGRGIAATRTSGRRSPQRSGSPRRARSGSPRCGSCSRSPSARSAPSSSPTCRLSSGPSRSWPSTGAGWRPTSTSASCCASSAPASGRPRRSARASTSRTCSSPP